MQRISQRVQTVDLQQIPDMGIEQLVRLLASSQPGVAQRAALSLRTQGFDDRRLELASELATCSTSRRVHLLNQLVQSDLEPAPWLIWMAEDGEPEVRLLAASWLNSMVTPEIQRRLRGLLPSESDERVAQVMRQALLVSPDLSLR